MDAFSALWTMPPPFNMIVVIVALLCVTSVIEEIIKAIRGGVASEMNRRMKRDLIDEGMSIDEAERWAKLELDNRDKRSEDKD